MSSKLKTFVTTDADDNRRDMPGLLGPARHCNIVSCAAHKHTDNIRGFRARFGVFKLGLEAISASHLQTLLEAEVLSKAGPYNAPEIYAQQVWDLGFRGLGFYLGFGGFGERSTTQIALMHVPCSHPASAAGI